MTPFPTWRQSEEAQARPTWRCGHPRTPENTKTVGLVRSACRTCFREMDRNYRRARRARERQEVSS